MKLKVQLISDSGDVIDEFEKVIEHGIFGFGESEYSEGGYGGQE